MMDALALLAEASLIFYGLAICIVMGAWFVGGCIVLAISAVHWLARRLF